MRKLIWCCTAAGVVAGGAVCAVARQACCPQAAVSQGAAAAIRLMHPLVGLALGAGRLAYGPTGEETVALAPAEEEIPAEPKPVAAPEPEGQCPAPGSAPITILEEEQPAATGSILAFEAGEPPMPGGCAVAPVVTGTLCPPATVAIDPGQPQAVECPAEDPASTCPMSMPYCTDEEATADSPPPMPRADEEPAAAACSFFQFFTGFFGASKGSSEVQPAAGPGGDAPSCQEDEHYYEHYSGCPYSGYHVPSSRCPVTPIDAEPAKRPGQDECSEEQGAKKHKVHHRGPDASGEERPAHPDVDTMEYRRSDGGLNEYGPGPF